MNAKTLLFGVANAFRRPPQNFGREIVKQIARFTGDSFRIVFVCLGFTGLIVTLEYSYHMKLVVGDDSMIPAFAMILLTRELAPVITSMLLASQMGAGIAAELAVMKNTDELEAYRLVGIDPIASFVAPQVVASAISCSMLAIVGLLVSVVMVGVVSIGLLHFSSAEFYPTLLLYLTPLDLIQTMTKGLVFGAVLPLLSAWAGFRSAPGSLGVGLATTDAVVSIALSVLGLDLLLTLLFVNLARGAIRLVSS